MKIKKLLFIAMLSFLFLTTYSQEDKKLYDAKINAEEVLEQAIKKAKAEDKHVFIQIGGNWCSWCIKMHDFYNTNLTVDSLLTTDYVPIVVNYSSENKNLDLMQRFEYPQRFGFPVLIILNSKGELLHTQNSLYLEEGNGYSEKSFIYFLKAWNKVALTPEQYK